MVSYTHRTALIVVDVQNDFADPAGSLYVEGEYIRKGADGSDAYSGFSTRDPRSGEGGETPLAGLATDYCVRDTALDAVRLGWETTVMASAIAAVDLEVGDGAAAMREMREGGVRIDSE